MLQAVQFRCIYSCICKAQRLRKTIFTVKTGIFNRHKPNICGTCDPHDLCQCIHGIPYSPCTSSTGQEHDPYSSDDGRFFRKARLCYRLICTTFISIFMPGNIHMVFSDHLLHCLHFPVCLSISFRICSLHPRPMPFAISMFFSIFRSK